MRILVTGGVGFIGTNLVKRLLEDNHEVISIDNYYTGTRENELDGCLYLDVDVSDHLRRHGAFGLESYQFNSIDVIFHLSAMSRIQPSFDYPEKTFRYNVNSTVNLLEYSKQKKIPIVYAGTSSIHGDKYINPYTFTKWQSEEVIKMYSQLFDIPSCICRFYNAYGPYQSVEGDYCNVLGIFERQYKNNEPLTITGDGKQRRDFVDVRDIVDGMVKCMEAMHGSIDMIYSAEIFELGVGKNYSINEIAKAFGEDYPVRYIDSAPGEMRETLNTNTKARDLLGWNPTRDITNFIKETYILKK